METARELEFCVTKGSVTRTAVILTSVSESAHLQNTIPSYDRPSREEAQNEREDFEEKIEREVSSIKSTGS